MGMSGTIPNLTKQNNKKTECQEITGTLVQPCKLEIDIATNPWTQKDATWRRGSESERGGERMSAGGYIGKKPNNKWC